jgi:hypothetical protein
MFGHMLTDRQRRQIDAAGVGVLGHVTGAGLPNAVAVTPYVVEGQLVVTSTLALIDKADALRRDPRVTLSAGGVSLTGLAEVRVDPTPRFFDDHIREQELVKYPPARSLLGLPLHRRLLPWYVGRVIIFIRPTAVADQHCGDEATLTTIDGHGQLRTWNLPRPPDLADPTADRLAVPADVADGPALLLVHEEDAAMRDLRQLGIRGTVSDGELVVSRRRGSLTPSPTRAVEELASLRRLAAKARANRARLADWPQYT